MALTSLGQGTRVGFYQTAFDTPGSSVTVDVPPPAGLPERAYAQLPWIGDGTLTYPLAVDTTFNLVLNGVGPSSSTVTVTLSDTYADSVALVAAIFYQASAAMVDQGFTLGTIPGVGVFGLYSDTEGEATIRFTAISGSDAFAVNLLAVSPHDGRGPFKRGDRLFAWVDTYFGVNSSTFVTFTLTPGWTQAHVGVGSGSTGTTKYLQAGALYTREWEEDGDETLAITATLTGASVSPDFVNTVAFGAHQFGYTGARLEMVAGGRLESLSDGLTPPGATTTSLPGNTLVLTYATHLAVGVAITDAPYMAANPGYTMLTRQFSGNAPSPVVPLNPPARFRVTSAFPSPTSSMLGPATVDGVAPNIGDRLFCSEVSPFYLRGIYRYNGSGVPMTRVSDADSVTEMRRLIVDVTSGDPANQGRWYQYEKASNITSATVNSRSQFRKSPPPPVPSFALASAFATDAGLAALPQWQVRQGNTLAESHAGWSAWHVLPVARAGLGVTSGTVLGMSAGPSIR